LFPTVATTGARSSRVWTCPTTRRRLDALLSSSTVQSSRATAWVSTTPRRQQPVAAKAVKTWPARRRGKRPVSAPRGLLLTSFSSVAAVGRNWGRNPLAAAGRARARGGLALIPAF
jgi:hypothetical protein